jgi:predicted N-acetyltransferase YhbS
MVVDLTCLGLDTLTTLPQAQRRGAASLLLQWGIERAAKDGLPIFLYAEPQGHALYKRFGFVEIKGQVIRIPLKEYGGDGHWVIVPMVKEP